MFNINMPHPTLLTSNTKVSLIPLPVQKKIKGKRGEPGDNLSHEKITNGQMNEPPRIRKACYVRGHHIVVGEVLVCERELNNTVDTYCGSKDNLLDTEQKLSCICQPDLQYICGTVL